MADSNKPTPEVKAYQVIIYECECPECEETVQLPDDDCHSGASFTTKCRYCDAKFPVRCDG
ncbi:hypothetical protein [Vibrio anguillarum]|uniref:hypothetical protein n=1 Tax=Vibrio anguillarum TaxID=55601 RepID=UPI00188D0645|nr:hypothetical protein [Vibrio anguillarum]